MARTLIQVTPAPAALRQIPSHLDAVCIGNPEYPQSLLEILPSLAVLDGMVLSFTLRFK